MTEEHTRILDAIKLKYFYSKHISLKNYIKFENIQLPDFIDVEEILHWNQEKRLFLRKEIQSVTGLHENYIKTLMERLDVFAALQDKLVIQLQETTKVADMRVISQSLQTVVQMYDETIYKLNIDAIVDAAYEANKFSTDELLLDIEQEEPDELEFDQD